MKAIIQVGVRRQGSVVDHAGPHRPISRHEIDVPSEDLTEKRLAVSVTHAEIRRALYDAGAQDPGLDTVEFTVDFES